MKQSSAPRNGKRGFTLVEVLVALVVLSLGLTGMIPMLIHTVQGNSFSRDTTTAATYAQDKLEELRRLEWGHTALQVGTYGPLAPAPGIQLAWKVQDWGTSGNVRAIEVCASAADSYASDCFSAAPVASKHFFSLRSNL